MACTSGHTEIAKKLIRGGANVNTRVQVSLYSTICSVYNPLLSEHLGIYLYINTEIKNHRASEICDTSVQ